MFIKPNGGVIALIASARLAYIAPNGEFNNAVSRYIFAGDESGRPKRIGDIIKLGKNDLNNIDDNELRFFVFGDPAMRLAYAPLTARIEAINGQPVDSEGGEPLVFGPNDSIEFVGQIIGLNGEMATGFNGTIISTLYGPEQSVTTHGYGVDGKPVTYEDHPSRLAINFDTVVGGQFTARVVIPDKRNVEYDNYRPALINLYAYDSRDTLEAKGSCSDFYIYGCDYNQETDSIGPDIITMVLNDESFVNGSDVNASPLLLATVADESGVNLTPAGSVGSMVLVLDYSTIYYDVVNDYTPMYAEQGTLGSISYQLNDLPLGHHNLGLFVWDVYGNSSGKTISFNVTNASVAEIAASNDLDIYSEFNGSETTFYVRHNYLAADVKVTVEVYDLMGCRVWQTTQPGSATTVPVTWNLQDDGGRRVPGGIYIYRAIISADGIKEATKAKKLAVTGN